MSKSEDDVARGHTDVSLERKLIEELDEMARQQSVGRTELLDHCATPDVERDAVAARRYREREVCPGACS